MHDSNIKIKIDFNSIILSLYLSLPMFSKFIVWLIPIDNANVIIISVLTFFFIIFNRRKFKVSKLFLIINAFVMLLFLVSLLLVSDTTYTVYYFLNYILYCFLGMLFIQYDYEFQKILKGINYVFILYTVLLFFHYFPIIRSSVYLDFTMELSYSALIGYVATIIYNFKYNKSLILKIISICCLAINTYYLIFLNDNRGSLVALLLFFIVYFIKNLKKLKYRIIVFIASLLIGILSINVVLNYIANMNTDVNWILRMQYQMKINNISTSRDVTYGKAIDKIKDSLIIGNGIGAFENFTNGAYAHNFILQISCENGVILSIVLSIFLLKSFCKIIFKDIRNEEDLFMLFIFTQFIPRLLVSSVQWINSFFWIYLYLSLEDSTKKIFHKSKIE